MTVCRLQFRRRGEIHAVFVLYTTEVSTLCADRYILWLVRRFNPRILSIRCNEQMEILVAREPVSKETLDALAKEWHHELVKGVADISRAVVALGGEWHIDANNRLIEESSEQKDLWGFNIYQKERGDKAIEYNSLINIRPLQGNRSMEIMDEETRKAVRKVVALAVPFLGL